MTSILELPELALANILSFLEYESLEEAQMVASPFYFATRNYRSMMAKTKIPFADLTLVHRKNTKKPNVLLQVEMRSTSERSNLGEESPKFFRFNSKIDNQAKTDNFYGPRTNITEISEEFVEWFAAHFTHVEIDLMFIHEFPITEHEISYLEKHFGNKKCRAKRVSVSTLFECDKTYVDRLLRFVSLFTPQKLDLHDNQPELAQLMMTDRLFNMLPMLESLGFLNSPPNCITNGGLQRPLPMPANFFKFPPRCVIGTCWLADISCVRKGLHEWAHNRLRIESWAFSFPVEFLFEEEFVEQIALPIFHKSSKDGFFVRNSAGQELHIRNVRPAVLFEEEETELSVWFIGGDPRCAIYHTYSRSDDL